MNLTWSDIATVCNLDRGVADDRFVNIGGPARSEGQLLAKRVCDKLATYDFVPASEIVKIEPKDNIFNLYSLWSSKYIDVLPNLNTDLQALSNTVLVGNSFVMQKGYDVIKRVDVKLRRTGNVVGDVVMQFFIADYDTGVPALGATPVATLKVPANSITTNNLSEPSKLEIVPFIFPQGQELVVQPNTRVIFALALSDLNTSPNKIEVFRSSVQYLNVTNNVTTKVVKYNFGWESPLPVVNSALPFACRIWASSTTQSPAVKPINVFYTEPSTNAFTYRKYLADPEVWTYNNTAKQIVFNSNYNNFSNLYLEFTHQWLVRDSETNQIKPYFEKGEDLWIMPQDFNECMYQGVLEYVYKKEKRFLENGSTNDYEIVKSEFQQEINRVLSLIPQVEKKHPQTSSYQY